MRAFCGMMIAAAALAVAPAAMAQAPAAGNAYMVTYIEVVPSSQGEAAGLLKTVAAASRKEAGNQRYDILQRVDRENQFVILEAWTDLKAAEAHVGGSALKRGSKTTGQTTSRSPRSGRTAPRTTPISPPPPPGNSVKSSDP